jgi:hypothetical protein
MRPGGAGSMLAAQAHGAAFTLPARGPCRCRKAAATATRSGLQIPQCASGASLHPAMPLRISAMRALGAYHNVFSIESFIDELAGAAGRRSRRSSA